MTTYNVEETQNFQSVRPEMERIQASSMSAAKRSASRTQYFQGTTLKIYDEDMRMVAYKEHGKWIDAA